MKKYIKATIFNESIFEKTFDTATHLTKEQKHVYEENLIQYWGMKSALETAVDDKLIEVAKNFIELHLDNATISKITGLTIEQIEKLRNIKE